MNNNREYRFGVLDPFPGVAFGSGFDGDVTVSVAATLAREMFYRNLTLDGVRLTSDRQIINVSDTLHLTDTLATGLTELYDVGASGLNSTSNLGAAAPASVATRALPEGGNGSAGVNGRTTFGLTSTQPTQPDLYTAGVGGAGGDGGAGDPNAAGVGGLGALAGVRVHSNIFNFLKYLDGTVLTAGPGGRGGGGGGGDGANSGGGGGSGGRGGPVMLIRARNIIIDANCRITCKGGPGGNGFNPAAGNAGAGGPAGGGGGGIIIIVTANLQNLGTIQVPGGAAGVVGAGHGTGTNGTAAGDGGLGSIWIFNTTTGIWTIT